MSSNAVSPTYTPTLTFATLGALTAADTANFVSGDIAYAQDVNAYYQLQKNQAIATADSVVTGNNPTGSAAGFWVVLPNLTTPVQVRNVATANVADLTAFTVAGNDGITNAAGDLVLLTNQTTATQNGIYVVGTVTTGTAPLTAVATAEGATVQIKLGTVWKNSEWKLLNSAAPGANYWYPKSMTQLITLTAGIVTVTNVPILSTTKTGFSFFRTTPSSPTGTALYGLTATAAVSAATGTGSYGFVVMTAQSNTGAISTGDVSSGNFTVTNW